MQRSITGLMDMETMLLRYFGTTEIGEVRANAIGAATERMLVDLGLETDPGKRFGLWSLMYMLDAAPDLDTVFEEEGEREAARNFMDLAAVSQKP
jgi:hypothetical protein